MTKKEKDELYQRLFKEQYGRCAICGELSGNKRFAIDHDHKTNEVRGLLCFKCNIAVGLLRDDPLLMMSAWKYIDEDRWEADELKELNQLWRQRCNGTR